MIIDYKLLAEAISFYESHGFKQIEVDYIIPSDEMRWTPEIAKHDKSFTLDDGMFKHTPHELVGSAEQSFAMMISNGTLKPGRYMAVTPCFRFEPEGYGRMHQMHFIKLELINYEDYDGHYINDIINMVNMCRKFFSFKLNTGTHKVQIYESEEENFGVIDLMFNNIEVGSYGSRDIVNGLVGWKKYIYGTGLALPRFSLAKESVFR